MITVITLNLLATQFFPANSHQILNAISLLPLTYLFSLSMLYDLHLHSTGKREARSLVESL